MQLSHGLRIINGDNIAFIGGGGKTTAMFQLATELASTRRVLTTTSTRIFAAQIKRSPAHVTFEPDRQAVTKILPALKTAIERYGQVLLVGQTDPESGKAFGVPSDIIDTLAANGHFDVIINEADGSRMRPFKAPAEHEPVIPASTTVVVPVVGMDVVGGLLTDEITHRAAIVSRLSQTPLGEPITVETVAAVLSHLQGGLKNVPTQARVIPLLNKAESPADLTTARQIAASLLTTQRIDSVAIGAVQAIQSPIKEVHSRTAAVILAAGGSTRFGSPKQLAFWGEQTFIERAVILALAAKVDRIVVVLGAEIEQCRAVLAGLPVEIVINERWDAGQSTSMQAGLAALPDNVGSALFMLVDLPGVRPETLEALIQRHRQTLAPIVWPEFEERRGNPVLFDRTLFPELRQISGDIGGRPLLQAYRDRAERVAIADPAILQDFDRPEDLAKIKMRNS